jgi:hypothetical protein
MILATAHGGAFRGPVIHVVDLRFQVPTSSASVLTIIATVVIHSEPSARVDHDHDHDDLLREFMEAFDE